MKKDESTVEAGHRPKTKGRRAQAAEPKVKAAKKKIMKAAAIDQFGAPSALKIHELPVPQVEPDEVLIALYASGVGVWDTKLRGGWWPEGIERPGFPLVLGSDGAGIVAQTGANVKNFHTGDRVWACEFINPKGGFYAEYVAVNEEQVALVPKQLDLLQAGAAAVTGLTAIQGIEEHLKVREPNTVLIFGASGAVGSLAVQFAKCYDAKVIGTARGPEESRLVKELGADKVIDPEQPDALDQIRAFAPTGIDAVLALAGGDSLQRLLQLVRSGGRIAHPNGVMPEPVSPATVERISYNAQWNPREFDRLNHAVEKSRLRVPIAAVRSLDEAAEAHERLEKGHVAGRIVLQIRGDKELREASE